MEKEKLLFVDVKKKTSTLSNITYQPEAMYKAYDRVAHDRILYVPISMIEAKYPEFANELMIHSLKEPLNKKPA